MCNMQCRNRLLLLLLLYTTIITSKTTTTTTTAFVLTKSQQLKNRNRSTILVRRGIQEWKDMEVSFSHHIDYEVHGSLSPLRPISILPMEYSSQKVPLPGETIYLQFVEESDLELFEMTLERYEGIFAIGLISNNDDATNNGHGITDHRTMLTTVPLLEIHEYIRFGDGLGTFCAAKVLGKGKIHQVFWPNSHRHPFFALVNQPHDEFQSSEIFAANQVADGIEFLLSYLDDNNDDDDDDSSDDNDQTIYDDFWAAYEVALQNDPQDFCISIDDVHQLGQRSWRELNAMSWAAFAVLSSQQEPQQRLMALNMQNVLGRLQLARNLLSSIRHPATTTTTSKGRRRVG